MVMSRKKLLGLILAAGAGIWLGIALLHRESPELRIRRTIGTLADCASKLPGTGAASSLAKVRTAGELFTDPAMIEIAGTWFHGPMSQVQIQQHLARYRTMFATVQADTEDLAVTMISPDQGEAVFSGKLRGRMKTGTFISEVREIRVRLVPDRDGNWRIRTLQAENVLEK